MYLAGFRALPFVKEGQFEKSRPSLQGSVISHDQCPHSGCLDNLVMHILDREGRAADRKARVAPE